MGICLDTGENFNLYFDILSDPLYLLNPEAQDYQWIIV